MTLFLVSAQHQARFLTRESETQYHGEDSKGGSFLKLLLGARLAKNCSPCHISCDIVSESVVIYRRNLAVHTQDIYNQN